MSLPASEIAALRRRGYDDRAGGRVDADLERQDNQAGRAYRDGIRQRRADESYQLTDEELKKIAAENEIQEGIEKALRSNDPEGIAQKILAGPQALTAWEIAAEETRKVTDVMRDGIASGTGIPKDRLHGFDPPADAKKKRRKAEPINEAQGSLF